MTKIFLTFSFFGFTASLLLASIFFLLSVSYKQNKNNVYTTRPHSVAFAALPSLENKIEDKIFEDGARVEIVRQFFERYNSPLEPHAATVIEAADLYDLDFRLIPAIAIQESNLCKRSPPNSHNCWGFGIYGDKVTRFSNFEEAIHTVTKTLALKYKADGLITPYEIMKRYTPQSQGSWAEAVEFFMDKLQ